MGPKPTSNFAILTLNNKKFVYTLNFLNYWNFLLIKKGILSVYTKAYFVENKFFLNYSFFFRTSKIKEYKKKLTLFSNTEKKSYQNKLLYNFLLKEFKFLGVNLFALKIITLNKLIISKTLLFLYLKNKQFIGKIFTRRLHLFLDFIKLESLFLNNLASTSSMLTLLAQIFYVLPKKKHNHFVRLLKLNSRFISRYVNHSLLKGIKFVIRGKLKGKTRSSSTTISFGEIPIQTVSKYVDYSKVHVFTKYGVFGFKL